MKIGRCVTHIMLTQWIPHVPAKIIYQYNSKGKSRRRPSHVGSSFIVGVLIHHLLPPPLPLHWAASTLPPLTLLKDKPGRNMCCNNCVSRVNVVFDCVKPTLVQHVLRPGVYPRVPWSPLGLMLDHGRHLVYQPDVEALYPLTAPVRSFI
jgi:hypothetical protein